MDLLLTKCLKAVINYEGIQRIETYPVPEDALREAVLNALIHRNYCVPAPIQIRVYAERLYIWNPCELPAGWSLETLLNPHASQPFNPDISNTFFWVGEIESWGRGIQRIFDACRRESVSDPHLRIDSGGCGSSFDFQILIFTVWDIFRERLSKKLAQRLAEKKFFPCCVRIQK